MKVGVLIFLGLLVVDACMPAHAIDLEKAKRIANNFSHQNLICSVYSRFVAACLGNRDKQDTLVGQYEKLAETFAKRSAETAVVAGVSAKALEARMQIAVDEMKEDIDNDCTNVSVILQKHARACKELAEKGPSDFANMIEPYIK